MVVWIWFFKGGVDFKDVCFYLSNLDVVYGCSVYGFVCGFCVNKESKDGDKQIVYIELNYQLRVVIDYVK